MKFNRVYTLGEISNMISCEYFGDENFPVSGINEIHRVEKGDIVFVDHPKYYEKALNSNASIILVNDKNVECPKGKALIISDDPFRDFNKIITYFNPFKSSDTAISSTAKIGQKTIIQPNVFIGNNVSIGENCIIHANVSIYDNTIIGNNVIIHSSSVLGADAFYYKKRQHNYDKFNCGGNVVIEDNVEIGACTTIDKGVTYSTTIKKGTKLDNHIQIGHDTIIGKNNLFASHVKVAGCTTTGDNVTLWGGVSVVSGITISDNTVVLGDSAVTKSLNGGGTYFGAPAQEHKTTVKQLMALRFLPEIVKKFKR